MWNETAHPLMPSDPHLRQVLKDRARDLRLDDHDASHRAQHQAKDYLHVRVGTESTVAFPYEELTEVLAFQSVTPIPNTPETICGVIHHSGSLVTVLNGDVLVAESLGAWNGIVLVDTGGGVIGLAVTEILGSISISRKSLTKSGSLMQGCIQAITDDGVAVVSPRELVTGPSFDPHETLKKGIL